MKKTSKSASKKPAAKKPAAKKSSPKPKRKAAGQGDLALVVTRLELVADKLTHAVERLARAERPYVRETREEPEGTGEVVGVVVVDENNEE